MILGGSFFSAACWACIGIFSRKHFWHSLKKHFLGFKVVFKNQSSFFSETSSLNPINIQDLNRHFFANVPGKDPHICIPIYGYPHQSAFFKDGEFLRLILSTKMKGHSLRNISGL